MKTSIVVSPSKYKYKGLGFEGENLQDIFEDISSMGYDGAEMFLEEPSDFDPKNVKETARSAGVDISSLDTSPLFLKHGLHLLHPDPEKRKLTVNLLEGYLRFASELESRATISLVRGSIASTMSQDYAYDLAVRGLKKCRNMAEECGVTMLLEPLNRYEINFINTLEEAMKLVKDIESDRLMVLADTFHMNIEEPSIESSLSASKDSLGHVHVADSNRLAPGMGHLNFEGIIKTLKSIGYDDYLTVEVVPKPNPRLAAERAIGYLKPLISGP